MSLDHEAIYKAYPDAVTIDDGTGAFKADGTKITLVQSAIDTARTTLMLNMQPLSIQETGQQNIQILLVKWMIYTIME